MKISYGKVILAALTLGVGVAQAKQSLPVYTAGSTTFSVIDEQRDFVIKLTSYADALGYKWDKDPSFNHEIFKLVDYKKCPKPILIGVPCDQTWTFHTRKTAFEKAQMSTISFGAAPPSEGTISKTIMFTVNIGKKGSSPCPV